MTIDETHKIVQVFAPMFSAVASITTATCAVLGYRLAVQRWMVDTESSLQSKRDKLRAIIVSQIDGFYLRTEAITPKAAARVARILGKLYDAGHPMDMVIEEYKRAFIVDFSVHESAWNLHLGQFADALSLYRPKFLESVNVQRFINQYKNPSGEVAKSAAVAKT